jgi:cyclic pyranopterin phosphate synthase
LSALSVIIADHMRRPKPQLSHLDSAGRARMVDVGHKRVTARVAVAEGFVTLQPATVRAIAEGTTPKGEVLGTARIAGILAAKRCGDLIPLCHPLAIESVEVDFELPDLGRVRTADHHSAHDAKKVRNADPTDDTAPVQLRITATARITAKTGVEMEALTAVAVAALTVYDMCKAIDKTMVIGGVRLVSKSGGTKL